MTARKDFLQSLTLGKKSEPTAEYAPSLRSPWRASIADMLLICKKFLKNDFSFFGQFVSTRKTRGKYLLEFITKCAGPENTILLAIAAERSKGKQLIWMLNEQYLNSGALNSHLFTYDNKKNRKKADKLLSLDLENILKKAISEPSCKPSDLI
ncbi:hypothetical protein [Candidiatus Paracoxiella cheracis]|uniref:hypothetical protein n=1 Tax=Candidiatus Paracoxiella cheracis TaxID=3405120 RepID=UPI003BF51642